MNVVEITRAKLHTDSATGEQEVRFTGSIKIGPDIYPDDVTAESVAEELISGIEKCLTKGKKRVRNQEQEQGQELGA